MPGASNGSGQSKTTGHSKTESPSKSDHDTIISSFKGADLKQEDRSSIQGTKISMTSIGGIFGVVGIVGLAAFYRRRQHGDFTAIESEISI